MRRGITLNNDRKAPREQRIRELEFRIGLANKALKILRDTSDPIIVSTPKEQLEERIEQYKEQMNQLVEECRKLKVERDGQPKGSASVGLKPADLIARNK